VVAIPPWAARIRCARVEPERGSERRKRGVGLALTFVFYSSGDAPYHSGSAS
jgi:hypothetical protein